MVEWFRHDTDARNDIKMRKLARDIGLAGIGAFWVAVEVLYDNGGTASESDLRDELDFIAPSGMLDVLAHYGLVTINEGLVTSARVQEEINYQRECEQRKSEHGRNAANARWSNARAYASMHEHTDECPAMPNDAHDATIPYLTKKKDISLSKDSSISKEKNGGKFVKPSIEEVQAYCTERENGVDAVVFWNFYESKGWKVGNTPMKDWKAAVHTWERSGNRAPQAQRKRMVTDKAKRSTFVNADGTLNLLGGTT